MRIGMMVDTYKPHISGITNYISLNKRYLEQVGHEVFVFTFGDEDYPDDETNVIRSPGLPIWDTGMYINVRHGRKAYNLMRTMDIIHVHHPFTSGALSLSFCRPRGIPVVFTNHTRYDLYVQAYLPGVADLVSGTFVQTYLPIFCRSCDLVISPSEGMRQVLVRMGVEAPIDVVPNGVDLNPFRQPSAPQDRSRFGFGPDDVILIYTGRLGPEKNLQFLLRSFAGTAQAYDHVGLVLVGDGPERDNLQDLVLHRNLKDRVHFTGMVPYDEMPCYLAMADAFVTASVTEVHPLSVIEAMAAGLPVLGIQSPGVGDTVEDGKTGFLSPEEDLAAFTARMVRLVIDHETRRAMATQAHQAAENYAIEKTVVLIQERYQKVVEKAAHRKNDLRTRTYRFLDRVGRVR
jgi:1,2-diacylglycerol 3-alpha-glucosyltransferase